MIYEHYISFVYQTSFERLKKKQVSYRIDIVINYLLHV